MMRKLKTKPHREDDIIIGLMLQFKSMIDLINYIKKHYMQPMINITSQEYNHDEAFNRLIISFESGVHKFPLKQPIPMLLLDFSNVSSLGSLDVFESEWIKQNGEPYGWFIDNLLINILQNRYKAK